MPTAARTSSSTRRKAVPTVAMKELLGGPPRPENAKRVAEHMQRRGYFYLDFADVPTTFHCHPEHFRGRYLKSFEAALREHPFLARYFGADTLFEGGYNVTWFPDTEEVAQPLESLMIKADDWRRLGRMALPPAMTAFLAQTRKLYESLYSVSSTLLAHLEAAYGLEPGSFSGLIKRKNDGAVRFVKYHRPNHMAGAAGAGAEGAEGAQGGEAGATEASVPHEDYSLFTFNLGETAPGLVHLHEGGETPLPARPGTLLVTSGDHLELITGGQKRPACPFTHTVRTTGERTVALGFVALDRVKGQPPAGS